MLRKMIFGLLALAAISTAVPTEASARGGFGGHGGGGFHGGGFHGGGFRGGGFRGGWGGRGIGIGLGLGLAGAGLYGAYGGYGGYGYPYGYGGGYPYGYAAGYDDDGGCYIVRKRIRTPQGIRYRRVEVCE